MSEDLDRRPAVDAPRAARWTAPAPRQTVAWLGLAALVAVAVQQLAPPSGPAGTLVAAVVALVGATTLASYLPRHGLRLDLGCTPCAVVAGLSVPAAVWLLATDMPGPAALVAGAGLVQRLRRPATCPT